MHELDGPERLTPIKPLVGTLTVVRQPPPIGPGHGPQMQPASGVPGPAPGAAAHIGLTNATTAQFLGIEAYTKQRLTVEALREPVDQHRT